MQLVGEVQVLHQSDVAPLTLALSQAGYKTATTYTGPIWQITIYKIR